MRVSITGTPGAGKHTIARRVAKKFDLKLIDLGQLAKGKGLAVPDEVRKTDIVDVEKLKDILKDEDDVVFVSNYAELIPADIIFVIRCHPKVLAKRLLLRNYPKEKIIENLEAECLDYCLISALEQSEAVAEIDNSGCLRESINTVEKILKKEEEPKHGIVNYSEYVDRVKNLLDEV